MRRSLITVLALAGAAAVPVSSAVAQSGPAAAGAAKRVVVKKRTCDRNYSGRCLKPNVSDYDCAGGSGNGPYYVRGPVYVRGTDHYRLDADGDGVACE